MGQYHLPIGRPISNTCIYILNEGLQPQPVGVSGELHIGGIAVARGYYNREKLTQERFIPNPYNRGEKMYKTGDLARWLPDGNIEFLGRIDDQVKISGVRIEPGEVEYALMQYPGVSAAFVVVHESNEGSKTLRAYIVPIIQKEMDLADLVNVLKGKLPQTMIPSKFILLDQLPLTSNGKIDRKALPHSDGEVKMRALPFGEPRNYTEEHILNICACILDVKRISIYDDFFDLGGHSLLAMQFINRIRQDFKIEIPFTSAFEKPTVAGIAEILKKLEPMPGQTEMAAKLRIKISKMTESEIDEMIRHKEHS